MFDLFNHLSRRERIASDPVLSRIWDRILIVNEVAAARDRLRAEEAKLKIFDELGSKK